MQLTFNFFTLDADPARRNTPYKTLITPKQSQTLFLKH